MHNIFYHYLDIKLFLVGIVFGFISFSNLETTLKLIASLLMIGYTARRWYLLEQKKNSKNSDDE